MSCVHGAASCPLQAGMVYIGMGEESSQTTLHGEPSRVFLYENFHVRHCSEVLLPNACLEGGKILLIEYFA